MLSPAKTQGLKATKQQSNNPAESKRAEIFTQSSDMLHSKLQREKRYSTFARTDYKFEAGNTSPKFPNDGDTDGWQRFL
jgi:hypothetical protein